MRTIAIGDIHGCSLALAGLLDAIDPQQGDTLIFLGDYVDRGPDSRAVIERLLLLSERCQTVFLRGNHDLVMQQCCEGLIGRELWESIGGAATLESYGLSEPQAVPKSHVQFLKSCVNFFETDSHIFVHGCYQPARALADTDLQCLLWCHLGWPLPRPHFSGKTVVVGHTPQTLGLVADFGHLVCIDTYCFGGGTLSAYDVHARAALQVDFNGRIVREWGGIQRKSWLGKMRAWFGLPPVDELCSERSAGHNPAQVALPS